MKDWEGVKRMSLRWVVPALRVRCGNLSWSDHEYPNPIEARMEQAGRDVGATSRSQLGGNCVRVADAPACSRRPRGLIGMDWIEVDWLGLECLGSDILIASNALGS
jgi:hypothetical protein